MKYTALATLLIALPASTQQAPQVTQIFKAEGVDLTVNYRAIPSSEDETLESLRSVNNPDAARKRINDAAARSPLGTLITKHELRLSGRLLGEGIHELWFAVDEDLRWRFMVSSTDNDEAPFEFPVDVVPAQASVPRLTMGLFPGETPTEGDLRILHGRQHVNLTFGTSGKITAAVTEIRAFIAEQEIDKEDATWKTSLQRPPLLTFDESDTYLWTLSTSVGPIVIELMPQVAPMHVSSTMYLTELGFYDGLTFHRVIPGFMAQGGCPLGRGSGGPGYQYAGEFDLDVKHDRPGLLSMAHAGPGTDGSQFFITFAPTPHLDGVHTIFGEVVQGMDTVRALEAKGSRQGRSTEALIIESAVITVR